MQHFSHKSDVWAFGMIIYELLHGHSLFSELKDADQLLSDLVQTQLENEIRADSSLILRQLILICLTID